MKVEGVINIIYNDNGLMLPSLSFVNACVFPEAKAKIPTGQPQGSVLTEVNTKWVSPCKIASIDFF